jgi:hypothetical protein
MKPLLAAGLMIASGLAAAAGPATALAAKLSYTLPSAAAPGETVDVVLFGEKLEGAKTLWTNLPGATSELAPGVEKNGTQAGQVTFRLKLPAQTALGVYGLRVATAGGISNLQLFMVDDLPTVKESTDNKSLKKAQEVHLPVAVDGVAETESYDFFKFRASAGQRLSLEVVARRLGSPLDCVVRLLDSRGRELAYSDDDDSLGADSRFSHVFQAEGEYFLEVRDIRYQGGASYRYRLRLGDFPLVTAPYPLAGRKGSTCKVVFAGPAVEGLAALGVKLPVDAATVRIPLAVQYPKGNGSKGWGSATVSLLASDGAEQVELEPNDTLETASPIELTGAVNGRFEQPRDRDYYRFDAKKGQHILFVGRTRTLGTPSDLFMRLYDAKGNRLAEAEDSGTDEGMIDHTFAADGQYRLMVEDLVNRGGPDHVYRVEIAPYAEGFTLAADADKFDAPQGGVFTTKVTCVRRGYKGPIQLSIEGAGEGFQVQNATIAENKNDALLTVTLPKALKPGEWRTLKIIGRAKIGNQEFSTPAGTAAALRTLFNGLSTPPADLDGALALGIGPEFPAFFTLASDAKVMPMAQQIGKASLKLKATKLNKFDDKIALAIEGLGPEFKSPAVAIDKGKKEAVLEFSGPLALAEGDYPLKIVGTGTFQSQPLRVEVSDVVLRVGKPIELVVQPAGPLPLGGKLRLKLRVTRFGIDAAPIEVTWKSLPPGIKAPEKLTLAEGKQELDVEIAATDSATLGPAVLSAIATLKLKDQTITTESSPITVEVTRK